MFRIKEYIFLRVQEQHTLCIIMHRVTKKVATNFGQSAASKQPKGYPPRHSISLHGITARHHCRGNLTSHGAVQIKYCSLSPKLDDFLRKYRKKGLSSRDPKINHRKVSESEIKILEFEISKSNGDFNGISYWGSSQKSIISDLKNSNAQIVVMVSVSYSLVFRFENEP